MVQDMKVTIMRERSMGKEPIHGVMAQCTLVTGLTTRSTAKEFIHG